MKQIGVAMLSRSNDYKQDDYPDPLSSGVPWWILYTGNYLPTYYPTGGYTIDINGTSTITYTVYGDYSTGGSYSYWPTRGILKCPAVQEIHDHDVRNGYAFWGYQKYYSDYSYLGTHYKMNGWLNIPLSNPYNQQFGAGAFSYKMLNNEPISSTAGVGGDGESGLIVMYEAADFLPPAWSFFYNKDYAPQKHHTQGIDHFNYLLWSGAVKTMTLTTGEIYYGNPKMPYYNTHPWFSSVFH
jgi:hypothetical protein